MRPDPILTDNKTAGAERAFLVSTIRLSEHNPAEAAGKIREIADLSLTEIARRVTIFPKDSPEDTILKKRFRTICEAEELRAYWLQRAQERYLVQSEQPQVSNFDLCMGACWWYFTNEITDETIRNEWYHLVAEQFHDYRAYKMRCLLTLIQYGKLPSDDPSRERLSRELTDICLAAVRYHAAAGLSLQLLVWLHQMALELSVRNSPSAQRLVTRIREWARECESVAEKSQGAVENACRKKGATAKTLFAELKDACGWKDESAFSQALDNAQHWIDEMSTVSSTTCAAGARQAT